MGLREWTAWHLLAFWAIWFAVASGFTWIIVGGALWQAMADREVITQASVAARLPTWGVIFLGALWAAPGFVSAYWAWKRVTANGEAANKHARRA